MEATGNYLVISADCHAAARWPDYEPYLERRHLDAFRAWYGALRRALDATEPF